MNNLHSELISFDTESLPDFINSLDENTRNNLLKNIATDELETIQQLSSSQDPEGLFGRTPDPDYNLPEIVLIHGITDCHLADDSNRVWFQFTELLRGNFTKCLTLQEDGVSDQVGRSIHTDGFLKKKYSKAIKQWRKQGFRCQVFCYDWRKSVSLAAAELDAFLSNLESIQDEEEVILVCHSMGGLVASTYASNYSNWNERIQHCVFAGSPLGGSYSVPMNVLAKSKSVQTMSKYSLFEKTSDFQNMLASFPGLIDMLPNPSVFPEAEEFYSQEGWPGNINPSQSKLDHSKAIKEQIWNSPLFSKATHLISQDHDTTSSMPWNSDRTDRIEETSTQGDGAVLSKSSLAPDLTTYLVSGEHGNLLNEKVVIESVMQIANDNPLNLPVVNSDGSIDDVAPKGLIPDPISSSPITEAPDALAVNLARHYASDSKAEALLSQGEPGFNRVVLYQDAFSWEKVLTLAIASEAAYTSDKAPTYKRAIHDWGYEEYESMEHKNAEGFICWDAESVLISYRGTEGKISDWIQDLKIASFNTGEDKYGKVHSGFYHYYKHLEPQLLALLDIANAKASNKRIIITGHSLGGAMATIAGAELTLLGYDIGEIYTFGEPKVGRQQLIDFHHEHLSAKHIRFRNNRDIVTRIPPNYKHSGQLYWFDKNGKLRHAGPEDLIKTADAPEDEPEMELSNDEFDQLLERINQLNNENMSELPLSDAQIDALLSDSESTDEPKGEDLFGLGDKLFGQFTDHKIKKYISTIRKHL